MPQIKISLDKQSIEFIANHEAHGFPSKSAMVDAAVRKFKESLQQQEMIKSAELYQEVYDEDSNLQELTDDAASLCLD